MPKVRDGNNRVSEFRVEPIGSPPGPVIRERVSEARMADFEAERAAASRRQAKPSKPAETAPVAATPRGQGGHWAQKRAAKLPRVLEAVRATPNLDDAAQQLGMAVNALRSLLSQYRVDGALPADVDELIRNRSNSRARAPRPRDASPAGLTAAEHRRELEQPIVAQAPRERPTADRPADPDVDVAAGGASPAPAEVGASAAAEAPQLVAGLPCTTCAHEPVCGLKSVLEAWIRDTPRPVPPLPVLHVVAARLTVSCDHHLAVPS